MPIHYTEYPGDGPILLLLHGVTRNERDWNGLLPQLTARWHVVTVDHIGHGKSDRSTRGYCVIDYARATADFVRETFSDPIVVMGHSLGAMVALWLAVECKSSVTHVVLEEPPFHTMGNQIETTQYHSLFRGMQAVSSSNGGVDEMAKRLGEIRIPVPGETVRLDEIRDRESLRFSAECLVDLDPDIFEPLVAGRWLDGFEYESLWSRVACPLLLLQGDPHSGGALSDADVINARKRLPRLGHAQFEGVGHQIHASRPDEVVAYLEHFTAIE